MSTEEKIGQLVMFGTTGNRSVSDVFAAFMQEYHIGNIFLCTANISKKSPEGGFPLCAGLTASLNAANGSEIPLLISIDEEGGSVSRLKWPQKVVSAADLGRADDAEAARAQFVRVGEGLRSVGISVNLAPCLDVTKNPRASWLRYRVISSDAGVATRIGVACIAGLQSVNCLAVAKHFPGHGATSVDSHQRTPTVSKTLEELREYELLPFAAAVDAGVDGIMMANIFYPNIDSADIAPMSEKIIGQLLRGEMGFEGIVMSDDFRMPGLLSKYSADQAAVRFILAGGDMILCGARMQLQRQIMEALHEAVAEGTITQERLDESVARILRAKMKYLGFEP